MKVKILQEFDGYPDGSDKSKTTYKAGQTVEVPDDFGKLIVGKKHAEAVAVIAVPIKAVADQTS